MALEQTVEHEPGHGGGGLVGPAEGPPDVVLGARLPLVVGDRRRARGVDPDREPVRGHALEDRPVLGRVEGLPVDVREDLHARRPEVADRPVDLAEGRLRVVHRERRHEAREAVGVPSDDLGHAVVGQPRQVGGQLRSAEGLDRGRAERQHLHVPLVAVHDPEAQVEVGQHRDRARPLLHVARGRHDLAHAVEEGLGEDVGKDVDLHRISRVAGRSGPGWTCARTGRPRGGPLPQEEKEAGGEGRRPRGRAPGRRRRPRARSPVDDKDGAPGPRERPRRDSPRSPPPGRSRPPPRPGPPRPTSAAGALPRRAGWKTNANGTT